MPVMPLNAHSHNNVCAHPSIYGQFVYNLFKDIVYIIIVESSCLSFSNLISGFWSFVFNGLFV